MVLRRLLASLLLLAATGCSDFPWSYCKAEDEAWCHDYDLNPGRCLTSPLGPFCALPDKNCPTGWRWSVLARDAYREKCVDSSIPLDAGVDAGVDQETRG